MRLASWSVFCCLCACAPAGAQGIAEDAPVAEVNEKMLTVKELRGILEGTPAEVLKYAALSPTEFLDRYYLIGTMAEEARKLWMASKSPYKERLAWARLQMLSLSKLQQLTAQSQPSEQEKQEYYEANKPRFQIAKVKGIRVGFRDQAETEGTALPTEEEARRKAESIRDEAARGADFVALVREHSDDADSKQWEGDFPNVGKDSTLPESIRGVILATPAGQVTGVLRQPNGFYIFKVISTKFEPYEEAAEEIAEALTKKRLDERMAGVQAQVPVKVENEEFFKALAKPGSARAGLTPQSVVARIGEEQITAGWLSDLLRAVGPTQRQNAAQQPQAFMEQLGRMRILAEMAEKEGLAERSPYKARLEWQQRDMLQQAMLDQAMRKVSISAEMQKKAYEGNKERWRATKVNVIYVSALPPEQDKMQVQIGGVSRPVSTRARARGTLEKIRAEVKTEEDFVRMVMQHSQDQESRAKDGDFMPIRADDERVPDTIRKAVLATEPGQMTPVLEQKNGFYLFRVQENSLLEYNEVRDKIYVELQQAKFNEWLAEVRASIRVKLVSEDNFRAALPQ